MSSLSSIQELPTNHVLVGVSETVAQKESFAEARIFFQQPRNIHLVLPCLSEADIIFATSIESDHYTYGTQRNKLYHICILVWQGIQWQIISIPRKEERLIKKYCTQHGRYLDRNMYTAWSNNKTEPFPFRGDSFRTVRITKGMIASFL